MFALLKKSARTAAPFAAAAVLVVAIPLSACAAAGGEVVVTPAVHQACQAMGLYPANADFAACTAVLTQAKGGHAQAVSPQVGREQQACAQAGVTPGTSAFSACVDNLDAALTQQTLMAN
ncbi:hypothetical protein [Nitrospirillum iridis]|uniref:Secreted protein n=1 Tax=Nitrospirillum iridis TaxID=765888 RepID=A0A7X0ECD3_9PROT|nr:hypothetical protein [Nitrospirillum iridis]MBB6251518.1 hypothetical protein [Nitrospirillum iridis]